MPDTPMHSVSVAGIVVDDQDRVLLIQRRDNGNWEPPGGVLELGETFEEGVKREVLEETGVLVEVDRLTGVYKNMRRGVVALVFRCSQVAGSPRETAEAASVAWVVPSAATALMSEAYAVRVTDALTDGCKTRHHDGSALT
ncbi:MAG: NUDIX hydrolase [Actinophytocola sp.]|uniref:NUDIX hydrolase n=1 Tax=Actinophytocola sp. TaxID=1872138 RepID=UPI003D6A09A7